MGQGSQLLMERRWSGSWPGKKLSQTQIQGILETIIKAIIVGKYIVVSKMS